MFPTIVLVAFTLLAWSSDAWKPIRNLVIMSQAAIGSDVDALNLTPKLRDYAVRLRNVKDDKLRYQQLLFLASQCPPMNDDYKVAHNKVPGCLSTVYVHANKFSNNTVTFMGDSDSQLTKGLVTLLVNGLSGHTSEEIQQVDPKFIQFAGIANSLTPGRNNGFLNMLALMKHKAKQVAAIDSSQSKEQAGDSKEALSAQGSMQSAILEKLSLLKPTRLTVENVSARHTGHAAMAGAQQEAEHQHYERLKETHFNVHIVAECFAPLTRVQRHQAIYQLLAPELRRGLHALSIVARSPAEEKEEEEEIIAATGAMGVGTVAGTNTMVEGVR